jgi:putative ABC transport system permease protein
VTVVKTSLRSFFAHKGRMALSAIAVLLSVAFVCGTLVFTDTINKTFDTLFNETAADVTVSAKEIDDAQDTGRQATVPVSLVERVEKVDGVKKVNLDVYSENITVIDADNDSIGPSGGAPTIGVNWQDTDRSPVELTSGKLPRGPGQAVVDADTADRKDVKIGDTLKVIAVPGTFQVKVTGIATFTTTNPGAALVFFDTATAQDKLLGSADVTAEIDLDAASGVSNDQLKKNVVAALGDDYKVQTQKEAADDAGDELGGFLDIMKYIMLGFAGIAVLVGVFLIVNTFSMLVAQRTRELGLLRAVGASRKQVNRSVLIEALLLGVIGSVLGIAGGIGLAIGLMELMGLLGMNLDTSQLTVKAATPIVGLVVGVLVTVVAAYLPARRAGRISPMAALRDAGTPADGKAGKVRAVVGLLLTAIGGAALAAAATADSGSQGGMMLSLGVLFTLLGIVVVGPLLAGFIVRGLSMALLRLWGPVGRMAERNALRNPRRTGATAAALMIGLSLVAGLSVVGSSLVASASEELDKSVGADFIVQSETQQLIAPDVEKAVRSVPGIEHFTEYRVINVKITTPDGKTSTTDVSAADPTYQEDLRVETVDGDLAAAYAKNGISVPEGFAEDHKVKVGDTVTVSFIEGGTAKLRVGAVTTDDTTLDAGAMYISTATAKDHLKGDKLPLNMALFMKAEDGKEKQAYAAMQRALDQYPQVKARDQADYKKLLEDQVGQLLNLVYGLLGLAIIVAILGVVNTLALSVVERTREIGLMRAIGMSRRQMRQMVRLESVVIALFGAVLGLGLGLVWGVTAQKLLELGGLKVLEIPWATIGWVFLGSALVGLIAALIPAYRAGRMNVLNAIATE